MAEGEVSRKNAYKCAHCSTESQLFSEAVDHGVIVHPREVLRIRFLTHCGNKAVWKTNNFKVVPEDIHNSGGYIIGDCEKKTITIHQHSTYSNLFHHDEFLDVKSPAYKRQKLTSSTPKRNTLYPASLDFNPIDHVTETPVGFSHESQELRSLEDALRNTSVIDDAEPMSDENSYCLEDDLSQSFANMSLLSEDEEDERIKMGDLLMRALDSVDELDHRDKLSKFIKMLADKTFPLDNIAYLLFLDVIQWYSLNTTSQMRYTEQTKKFWRVGLKLFKGKFIRFMSGLKHKYLSTELRLHPSESRINFAVPNRNVLDTMTSPINADTPGILTALIAKISAHSVDSASFKICVDGKKLNSGFTGNQCGDVNLWGMEGPPSLLERNGRLKKEIQVFDKIKHELETLELRGISYVSEIETSERLLDLIKNVLQICFKRIAELRSIRIGQTMGLEKLMSQTNGDWRKSRLSFVISALKSKVCVIDSLVTDLLRMVDKGSRMCAIVQKSSANFTTSDHATLQCQVNYRCLDGYRDIDVEGIVPLNSVLSMVQQRSPVWFDVRKLAVITGSTFHSAVGLQGLKKQQKHFRKVFCDEDEVIDSHKLKLFEHGTTNEVNAIATLVSKVMPVYYPDLVFYEEGCYQVLSNESHQWPTVVVSPDGSLRSKSNSIPVIGVEVKCPMPGKTFTEPIHYRLPTYYVPQVLCEMHVLSVDTLLFVSYSKESTSVLIVHNDKTLFGRLMNVASDLYPSNTPCCPKRLHSKIKDLKKDIATFSETNVAKLCEVPSVRASICSHEIRQSNIQACHREHTGSLCSVLDLSISDLDCSLHKGVASIEGSHDACRVKATEVLVFMAANTDRIHDPEVPHAMPIAYALKSYSMSADIMRKMIDRVLDECFRNGLYVPVISFDGQWCNLAVRDGSGKPLTILQLQKDVYQEAKNVNKSDLVKAICSGNTVVSCSFEKLIQDVDISYRVNQNMKITSPFTVGGIRSDVNVKFATSSHMNNFIQKFSGKKQPNQTQIDEEPQETGKYSNQILNSLPVDVVQKLDNTVIDKIKSIDRFLETACRGAFNPDGLSDVRELFDNDAGNGERSITDAGTSSQLLAATLEDTNASMVMEHKPILVTDDFISMLQSLKATDSKCRYDRLSPDEFQSTFSTTQRIDKLLLKKDIQTCIRAISSTLKLSGVNYSLSSPKYVLVEFLHQISKPVHSVSDIVMNNNSRKPRGIKSLRKLCKRVISGFPKIILNAIYAEHIFPSKLSEWRSGGLFSDGIAIQNVITSINWYSKPESVAQRFQWIFALLDPHHLYTNARTKCCSTGIPDRNIHKEAWLEVARSGKTDLNVAHVEDLVDRQSDAFAHTTFCFEVETEMRKNGYIAEAKFCKLIRQWYQAEDDPGLSAAERCNRRIELRDWLLSGVNFNEFPPPGTHVKGIPWIMFEGLMTNIDRRLQLFPIIKRGSYNVRALGSLEAENFFGEFQDLDPKGSGVIRADDLPCAISSASELISYRMESERPFYMHTSKAKVYPTNPTFSQEDVENACSSVYINPHHVNTITPADHSFDQKDRAERRFSKRKDGKIDAYGAPSRGTKGVRAEHQCNHAKVLPHKRLKIMLEN